MTLGEEIRELLEKREMSQVDLARETGISLGSINDYVNDRVWPSYKRVKKIQLALGTILEQYPEDKKRPKIINQEAKNLGDNIKLLLEEREITQTEFAELTGISRPTIGRMIRGQCNSNLLVLNEIAETLEISIDELIQPNMQENKKNTEKVKEDLGETLMYTVMNLPREERKALAYLLMQ